MSEDLPRHRTDLDVEIHDEEAHLTDPSNGETHVLNPSAFAIWELCDGDTRVETMAEAVAEVTPMDREQSEQQVRETIDLLKEKGLVE